MLELSASQRKRPDLKSVITPNVLNLIGTIDVSRVNSLISKLARDKSITGITGSALETVAPTDLHSTLDDYFNFFQTTGLYDRFLNQALTMYPYLDESSVDEIVTLSIWKSLYLFSWDENQYNERQLYSLIRSTIRFYALTERRNFLNMDKLTDSDQPAGQKKSLGRSDLSFGRTESPETTFFQKTSLYERIVQFTANKADESYAQLLLLLAQDVNLLEACQILGFNYQKAKTYLYKLRKKHSDLVCIKEQTAKKSNRYKQKEKRCGLVNFVQRIFPQDDNEKEIINALVMASGDQTTAAKKLGIPVNKIRSFLQHYGYFNG